MNKVAKRSLQAAVFLTVAGMSIAPAFCQQIASNRGSLPPCNMDSFVYQAGANAQMIYGDEGTVSEPPLFGYTQASRINTGITGINNAGLTTGHGSYMPSATGADEFLAPPGEWAMSGANNGNAMYNGAAAGLDATDAASQYIQAAADAAAYAQSKQNLQQLYQLEEQSSAASMQVSGAMDDSDGTSSDDGGDD